jgi:chromosome segregation ATPase
MAIDHVEPSLDALIVERHRLWQDLYRGPHDPSADLNSARQRLDQLQDQRHDARTRLHDAQRDLADLGPIAQRLRRHHRRDLTQTRDSAAHDLAHLDHDITATTTVVATLEERSRQHDRWRRDHQPEVDRLNLLNEVIAERRQQIRPVAVEPLVRELWDLGLGLER